MANDISNMNSMNEQLAGLSEAELQVIQHLLQNHHMTGEFARENFKDVDMAKFSNKFGAFVWVRHSDSWIIDARYRDDLITLLVPGQKNAVKVILVGDDVRDARMLYGLNKIEEAIKASKNAGSGDGFGCVAFLLSVFVLVMLIVDINVGKRAERLKEAEARIEKLEQQQKEK